MKIKFYKVLTYWKNGAEANYKKRANYDEVFFELFKDKVETKEKIVTSTNYTLFIFRKDSKLKDFRGRPIEQTAGLYSQTHFKNDKEVYDFLQRKLDLFDDILEYEIDVPNDFIIQSKKLSSIDTKVLLYGSVVFLAILVFLYLYSQIDTKKEPITQASTKEKIKNVVEYDPPIKKQEKLKDIIDSPKVSQNNISVKHTVWKWDKFCNTYKITNSKLCYEKYIEVKCREKNNFKLSYKKFAKQHKEIRSCNWDFEDENLKAAILENSSIKKQFFKGNNSL